jgi:hypothetical protein
MKKIIVLIVSLVIAGLIIFINIPDRQIHTQLSDRAKQYISSRQNNQDETWQNIRLKPKAQKSPHYTLPDCFSFYVPFPIKFDKPKGNCSVVIFTGSPTGRITIIRKNVTFTNYEDVPDIKSRLLSNQYTKNTLAINNREYYVLKKRGLSYETYAFHLDQGKMISIAFIFSSTNDFDSQLSQVITSLRYN